jgi:hypothetical protein
MTVVLVVVVAVVVVVATVIFVFVFVVTVHAVTLVLYIIWHSFILLHKMQTKCKQGEKS